MSEINNNTKKTKAQQPPSINKALKHVQAQFPDLKLVFRNKELLPGNGPMRYLIPGLNIPKHQFQGVLKLLKRNQVFQEIVFQGEDASGTIYLKYRDDPKIWASLVPAKTDPDVPEHLADSGYVFLKIIYGVSVTQYRSVSLGRHKLLTSTLRSLRELERTKHRRLSINTKRKKRTARRARLGLIPKKKIEKQQTPKHEKENLEHD